MASAVLLFSGGLDSMLVAEILRRQNIDVVLVCFKSYFFGCEEARKSAEELQMELIPYDISSAQLELVKNPRFSRGKGMNPCIDCHSLMLKKAKELMQEKGFDFLATGEVLGERPLSQSRKALKIVEKEGGVEGNVLRPLSAKLLPKTIPEREGWVEREKLYAFSGKNRKPQIELASQLSIKEYPSPSGGCILTDLNYAERLKDLYKRNPDFSGNDTLLLKKGRVVWQDAGDYSFLLMIGRNEEDNAEIEKLKQSRDILLKPDFPGPTVLIRSFGETVPDSIIEKGKNLILEYSKSSLKGYEKIRLIE